MSARSEDVEQVAFAEDEYDDGMGPFETAIAYIAQIGLKSALVAVIVIGVGYGIWKLIG